ncbi:hypothetical protein ACFXI3_43635 [Amycolatopsis sp. NPDC059235]|uniref:hypothetical protein n=1 Tax=Amycolatopsis sp. NPDC059235 TaxID=3346782 RepID=UPI00366F6E74
MLRWLVLNWSALRWRVLGWSERGRLPPIGPSQGRLNWTVPGLPVLVPLPRWLAPRTGSPD